MYTVRGPTSLNDVELDSLHFLGGAFSYRSLTFVVCQCESHGNAVVVRRKWDVYLQNL